MSTRCSVNAINPDAAGQGGAGGDWGLGRGCQDMGRDVGCRRKRKQAPPELGP